MKTYEISSAHNDTFKLFKNLLTSKGIAENQQAFIFGQKAIDDTLRDYHQEAVGLIVSLEDEGEVQSPVPVQLPPVKNLYKLKNSLFKELDIFGSRYPILLMKVPAFEKLEKIEAGCFLYLPIQDPGNMGAMLRSAAAFGVKGILLGQGASHPFHPRSSRAASAGLFHHRYHKISAEELLNLETPLVGLEKNGEPLHEFKFPKKFILVLGAEGPGLNQEFNLDFKVGISINKLVDSLNAPVAASIALYQWSIANH
jgi:TrmH family RNA methyltransferase